MKDGEELDVSSAIRDLANKRRVFHSEADFQHALAWEIHLRHPDAKIRLEYRPPTAGPRVYVDLWVVIGAAAWAIELKYKTRRLEVEDAGERFTLMNHSAQDIGRYDFLRDIVRLELLTAEQPRVRGAAILLTNDSGYWSTARSAETVDAAFRLHEGRSLSGHLAWGAGASAGTMRSREAPIALAAAYRVAWQDYSQLTGNGGQFRYALIAVECGRPHAQEPPAGN